MPSVVGTRRLDWLRNQREAAVAEISSIAERAADDDRDLTDEENSSCQRRREAVERLDREIAVEVDTCERQARYDDLAGRIEPALRSRGSNQSVAAPEPEVLYRSAGEYLADYLLTVKERDTDAAARIERYRSTLNRADQVLASNPGIVPTPVVQPVLETIDARRPAIDAATRRPMPSSGKSFTRPTITQHTTAGVQATEKTTLSSQALLIDDLHVDKVTYGGYVNLSWQDRDWTDPAILNLIVSDLAGAYAAQTDDAFCTSLVSGVSQTVDARTGATPVGISADSFLSALYQAAALVFASGNATPNTLWVAPDVWALLGSLVDLAGRPMFPSVSPGNAMGAIEPGNLGGNVAGFRLAVDANFATGTAIVGDNTAVEFFEQVGGTVSAVEPSVLGTAVAYFGYAATAVVRPNALVSLTTV